MMANLMERGLFAPLMHVTWSAMVGAALWRVRGDGPLCMRCLTDLRFWGVLILAMLLHTIWNVLGGGVIAAVVLGIAAWFIISGLVQQGLREI